MIHFSIYLLQSEEMVSGDISSQNEDSNDQPAQTINIDQAGYSEEGEVTEERLEEIILEQVEEEKKDVEMEDKTNVEEKIDDGSNGINDTEENLTLNDKREEANASVSVGKEGSVIKEMETETNEIGEAVTDIRVVKDVNNDLDNKEIIAKTENQELDKTEVKQEKISDKTEKESNEEPDTCLDTEKKGLDTEDTEDNSKSKGNEPLDVRVVKIETADTEKSEAVDNFESVVETEAVKTENIEEMEETDEGQVNSESEGEVEDEEEGEEVEEEEEEEEEEKPQDVSKSLTQNQMELLELEMRARAIKAMLKMAK